jgi:reversibly glycosylated polypeptide/UDP-arabinopyranose mutase
VNVLVIPTNRPERLADFFQAWENRGGWDRVIIVFDGKATDWSAVAWDYSSPPSLRVYSWEDIDDTLGDGAWIISRQDSAIRCFGFLMAHRMGADAVLTLDDDCYPAEDYDNLMKWHERCCDIHPAWLYSAGMRTRGIPYRNLGRVEGMANVGLWTGDGDWDSRQKTTGSHPSNFSPPKGNWFVPSCQLVPVCGMNLYIKRAALKCFYFPLQGKGYPYRRFDDIWGGVIAQTEFARRGWYLSVGEPFVEHRQASDAAVNAEKEAPGFELNEKLWEWWRIWEWWHTGEVMGKGGTLTADERAYCVKVKEAFKIYRSLFEKQT